MQTKTELRKSVGRGKFTAQTLAEAADISAVAARRRLRNLLAEGIVERTEDVEKVTNKVGDQRGRPRHTFRVAKGK